MNFNTNEFGGYSQSWSQEGNNFPQESEMNNNFADQLVYILMSCDRLLGITYDPSTILDLNTNTFRLLHEATGTIIHAIDGLVEPNANNGYYNPTMNQQQIEYNRNPVQMNRGPPQQTVPYHRNPNEFNVSTQPDTRPSNISQHQIPNQNINQLTNLIPNANQLTNANINQPILPMHSQQDVGDISYIPPSRVKQEDTKPVHPSKLMSSFTSAKTFELVWDRNNANKQKRKLKKLKKGK